MRGRARHAKKCHGPASASETGPPSGRASARPIIHGSSSADSFAARTRRYWVARLKRAMTIYFACARGLSASLVVFVFGKAELGPAGVGRLFVLAGGPDGGRITLPAEVGIGIVIEVDGGIDQHAVPFAGAEHRDVAVALARRGV